MASRSNVQFAVATLDALEPRTFFSVEQISFANFSSTSHLVGNGFSGAAINVGDRLRLTDNFWEARSVWFDKAVPIRNFTSHFSFQIFGPTTDPKVFADGFTFAIQGNSTSALGDLGAGLGFKFIDKSEAATFNTYNLGAQGSKFDYASNGELPPINTTPGPIDLHSEHLFHATVEYDGTTLKTTISDATDRSKVFSSSKAIDLPATVGGETAFVGFTAGTGQFMSTQEITSWSFSGTAGAPSALPATASQNPVTTDHVGLSALGTDPLGENTLTYTWSTVNKPDGADDPVFSDNGTNAAKNVTATFFKEGQYTFRCTITNSSGQTTSSNVDVRVKPTATKLLIDPHGVTIDHGQKVNYNAFVYNQFNRQMSSPPTIRYSVDSIAGTINPITGVFTASDTVRGHVLVTATCEDLVALAGATVHP